MIVDILLSTILFTMLILHHILKQGPIRSTTYRKNGCKIIHLGTTVLGRPMTEVQIGNGPLQIWLIGRQHPGETMAQWWMEGVI